MSTIGLDAVSARESTTTISQGNGTMGKDDFLTLLVAQLQAQDPLNPMDGTQFTAQLAQFTSLEQLQNINTNLEGIDNSQNIQTNSGAVGFIGKTVTALGDQMTVSEGQGADIHFDLPQDAAAVFVKIYDQNGSYVQSLEYGGMQAGPQSLSWDGTDQLGAQVPEGRYQYEITAIDAEENELSVTAFTSGKVKGINYKDGHTYLLTDSQEIRMGDVVKVMEDDSS
jgi:flagellar basal-body rod modification protein FlgD